MAKVLVIDDDPFILDMYSVKLREAGFSVDTAENGETGMEKFKKESPDVVLLDIVMPNLDGFTILETLRKEKSSPQTKIILLTNLGQKEDVERGNRLGADDYIIKAHFTPSEVVEKVKKILSA